MTESWVRIFETKALIADFYPASDQVHLWHKTPLSGDDRGIVMSEEEWKGLIAAVGSPVYEKGDKPERRGAWGERFEFEGERFDPAIEGDDEPAGSVGD